MEAKDLEKYIVDYIDGNLPKAKMQAIKEAIEASEECKILYEETKALFVAMSNEPEQEPSLGLRQDFYKMLEEEKQLQQDRVVQLVPEKKDFPWKYAFQIAASFVLLFLGFFAGSYNSEQKASKEIANLKEQTTELKQDMMLALIDNRSASKRIQAVSYTEEFTQPDAEIINALISRLQFDPSVNVRLAAAEALSKYSDMELVKKAFIDALSTEKNPDLQIAIIQFLVEVQEKRALEPMQQLLDQPDTPDFVKAQANSGISQII